MKEDLQPKEAFDLSAIRGVGSTGAPLVARRVHLGVRERERRSVTRLIQRRHGRMYRFCWDRSPLLPVHAGEIQCSCLGAKVEAFDEKGNSVINEVGELVVTEPLVSMPIFFWNDEDGSRLRESYFEMFDGVWRHGDWVEITDRGTLVISGRSDSTLKRSGIRMGTSDFYRVIEDMDEVADSLVVDTSGIGDAGSLLLFLVMNEGTALDDDLRKAIALKCRTELSPRWAPDEIHAIAEVPRTLNGKKVEVPVKRILSGRDAEKAVSMDAMENPESLRFFIEMAERRSQG